MPRPLSGKQQQVLQFFQDEAVRNQIFPTVRDVMSFLGVRNPRGAECHLKALARKGYLQHFPKTSRAYRIPPESIKAQPSQLQKAAIHGIVAEGGTGVADRPVAFAVSDQTRIPIVGRAPGGIPSAQEVEYLGELYLPIRVSDRAFAIRVVGDSMRDAHVIDGDLVVADPDVEPLDRSIVLALVAGAYTIKVLRKTASTWWLEAANEQYQPVIPKDEDDRIAAAIVALYRPKIARLSRAVPW